MIPAGVALASLALFVATPCRSALLDALTPIHRVDFDGDTTPTLASDAIGPLVVARNGGNDPGSLDGFSFAGGALRIELDAVAGPAIVERVVTIAQSTFPPGSAIGVRGDFDAFTAGLMDAGRVGAGVFVAMTAPRIGAVSAFVQRSSVSTQLGLVIVEESGSAEVATTAPIVVQELSAAASAAIEAGNRFAVELRLDAGADRLLGAVTVGGVSITAEIQPLLVEQVGFVGAFVFVGNNEGGTSLGGDDALSIDVESFVVAVPEPGGLPTGVVGLLAVAAATRRAVPSGDGGGRSAAGA